MIITKIEKQAKRDRYNIYLDGVYGFSLSSRTLLDSGLKESHPISEKEVEKIKNTDIESKAYSRATLILSYRANSEEELKKKLLKNFDEIVIEKAIQKLKKQGFINDDDFVERYVENSKKGKKIVKLELLKKGIDKETAEKMLENRSEEQELENAKALAEKVLKKYINEPELVQKKKLYENLTRKGFSYDIYKEVVKAD